MSTYIDWISSLTNITINLNTDNSSTSVLSSTTYSTTSGPSPTTYSTPSGPSGLSGGAIAGIVIGSVVGVAFLGAIFGLIAYCVRKSNNSQDTENDITKKIPAML